MAVNRFKNIKKIFKRVIQRGLRTNLNKHDFYETYRGALIYEHRQYWRDNYNMSIVPIRRPVPLPVDISKYGPVHPDLQQCFYPDKGWTQSLEHFSECFLTDSQPLNADGAAGALSTRIALALLKSLKTGQPEIL